MGNRMTDRSILADRDKNTTTHVFSEGFNISILTVTQICPVLFNFESSDKLNWLLEVVQEPAIGDAAAVLTFAVPQPSGTVAPPIAIIYHSLAG